MDLVAKLAKQPLLLLLYLGVLLLGFASEPNERIAQWAARRGWNFADRGYRRTALALGRLAVRKNSDWPGGYRALGHVFEVAGNRARARATYRQGLEANPTNPSLWHVIARLDYEEGNYRDAEAATRLGLQANSEYPSLLVLLAKALNMQRRHSEAAAILAQVKASGVDANGLDMELGRALALQGQDEHAEPYLRRALEREPDDAQGHYYMAVVLGNLGRWMEAREHAAIAARLDPDDESYAKFARVARADADAAGDGLGYKS